MIATAWRSAATPAAGAAGEIVILGAAPGLAAVASFGGAVTVCQANVTAVTTATPTSMPPSEPAVMRTPARRTGTPNRRRVPQPEQRRASETIGREQTGQLTIRASDEPISRGASSATCRPPNRARRVSSAIVLRSATAPLLEGRSAGVSVATHRRTRSHPESRFAGHRDGSPTMVPSRPVPPVARRATWPGRMGRSAGPVGPPALRVPARYSFREARADPPRRLRRPGDAGARRTGRRGAPERSPHRRADGDPAAVPAPGHARPGRRRPRRGAARPARRLPTPAAARPRSACSTSSRPSEGDTRRQTCVLRGGPCGRDGYCAVHPVFADAQDAVMGQLARFEPGRRGRGIRHVRTRRDRRRAPDGATRRRPRPETGRSDAPARHRLAAPLGRCPAKCAEWHMASERTSAIF